MWPMAGVYGVPGYGYGAAPMSGEVPAARSRRRSDRECSSDERGDKHGRKRRRDESEDDRKESKKEKKDKGKKEKDTPREREREKEKTKEKDKETSKDDKQKDAKEAKDGKEAVRKVADHHRGDDRKAPPPRSGRDAVDVPKSRGSGVEDRGERGAGKDKDRGERGAGKDRDRGEKGTAESGSSKKPAASPKEKDEDAKASSKGNAKNWREEMNDEGEDERDLSDDDAALDKKRDEARRKREAMAKKHKEELEAAGPKTEQADGNGAAGGNDGESVNGGAVAQLSSPSKAVSSSARGKEVDRSPAAAGGAVEAVKAEGAGDMFDERKEAGEELKKAMARKSQNIALTGASGEDWDDDEGYYIPKIGEVMDGRYLVVESAAGKGVFSNVVKAKDQQDAEIGLVAVKILRANDMMTKQAEKEVEILERLSSADKNGKKHVVRLLNTFAYRRHFCLVFECMHDDLRAALKKLRFGGVIKGMSLQTIRSYTQQLFVGLRHMHSCKILHADIKPDNILISKNNEKVKFCDLGTAVESKDVMCSPYLASRFYRAPEIILGCDFSQAVDVWALACTLYELFTGKILFQSKTNNDHLLKIMETKGKIPGKVIKKGAVWKTHFNDELDFKHQVEDKGPLGTGEMITRTVTDLKAKSSLKDYINERVGPERRQSTSKEDQDYVKRAGQFADLLELMLALDPEKRVRPEDAFAHPFLQDLPGESAKAKESTRSSGKEIERKPAK